MSKPWPIDVKSKRESSRSRAFSSLFSSSGTMLGPSTATFSDEEDDDEEDEEVEREEEGVVVDEGGDERDAKVKGAKEDSSFVTKDFEGDRRHSRKGLPLTPPKHKSKQKQYKQAHTQAHTQPSSSSSPRRSSRSLSDLFNFSSAGTSPPSPSQIFHMKEKQLVYRTATTSSSSSSSFSTSPPSPSSRSVSSLSPNDPASGSKLLNTGNSRNGNNNSNNSNNTKNKNKRSSRFPSLSGSPLLRKLYSPSSSSSTTSSADMETTGSNGGSNGNVVALFGDEDSGKTTLRKQLEIDNRGDITEDEREEAAGILWRGVIASLGALQIADLETFQGQDQDEDQGRSPTQGVLGDSREVSHEDESVQEVQASLFDGKPGNGSGISESSTNGVENEDFLGTYHNHHHHHSHSQRHDHHRSDGDRDIDNVSDDEQDGEFPGSQFISGPRQSSLKPFKVSGSPPSSSPKTMQKARNHHHQQQQQQQHPSSVAATRLTEVSVRILELSVQSFPESCLAKDSLTRWTQLLRIADDTVEEIIMDAAAQAEQNPVSDSIKLPKSSIEDYRPVAKLTIADCLELLFVQRDVVELCQHVASSSDISDLQSYALRNASRIVSSGLKVNKTDILVASEPTKDVEKVDFGNSMVILDAGGTYQAKKVWPTLVCLATKIVYVIALDKLYHNIMRRGTPIMNTSAIRNFRLFLQSPDVVKKPLLILLNRRDLLIDTKTEEIGSTEDATKEMDSFISQVKSTLLKAQEEELKLFKALSFSDRLDLRAPEEGNIKVVSATNFNTTSIIAPWIFGSDI